ncbi:MBL fold metallo-hydrolase [Mycolicibacterium smegmatis]|uniref:MBL fold metallo-hydrolase n=1 Tax=Mycolicibacterium smegmatis TaxID=1772 RepID=UPI001F3AFEF6|nr:MBL fold metallo-hydrolase [Mycolicibacterium smegmatis]
MTTRRLPFGVAVLGGPTTVVDIGGHRLICDPTFDPPTDYGYLQKLAGPAADESAVGDVDVALVSHDLHPDNLDVAGRAFALSAPVLLTTATAATRLGAPSVPLAPWTTWESPDGLAITAVPARHGPADGELNEEGFVNCEVIGFVVTAPDSPTVYLSGDNASVEIVREIRERIGGIDCAVLFAGSASVPAKFDGRPLSLTAERAGRGRRGPGLTARGRGAPRRLGPFPAGRCRHCAAFHAAGIGDRLCSAPLGHMCAI